MVFISDNKQESNINLCNLLHSHKLQCINKEQMWQLVLITLALWNRDRPTSRCLWSIRLYEVQVPQIAIQTLPQRQQYSNVSLCCAYVLTLVNTHTYANTCACTTCACMYTHTHAHSSRVHFCNQQTIWPVFMSISSPSMMIPPLSIHAGKIFILYLYRVTK